LRIAEEIMSDDSDHSVIVDAWMERAVASHTPPEELVRTFAQAFGAVWRRAQLTLGDVTLTAMLDRVLHTAVEQFAFLSSLEVEATGLRCDGLRDSAHGPPATSSSWGSGSCSRSSSRCSGG